jgi:hypothetical protein
MSGEEAHRARPEPGPREDAAEHRIGREKADPSSRARPLVHPALAFVCAGAATVIAGYTGASAQAWRELFFDVGLPLPALLEVVVRWPVGTPAALVLASVLVLALGALRSSTRAARWVAYVFALGTGSAALLLFVGQVMAFLDLDART